MKSFDIHDMKIVWKSLVLLISNTLLLVIDIIVASTNKNCDDGNNNGHGSDDSKDDTTHCASNRDTALCFGTADITRVSTEAWLQWKQRLITRGDCNRWYHSEDYNSLSPDKIRAKPPDDRPLS